MQATTTPITAHELASTTEQAAWMNVDRERVLRHKQQLEQWTAGRLEPQRMLGVVSCTHGAQVYLPFTIPHMLQQLSRIGYYGDLVLGFNNGFSSHSLVANFKALPNTEVIELYAPTRVAANQPAIVRTQPTFDGPPSLLQGARNPQQHRIIVVYQQDGLHSRGKSRMLGDIFLGLLLPSIKAGWVPPRYTLLFDAESIFIANQEHVRLDSEMEKLRLLQRKVPDDLERLVRIILQVYGRNAEHRGDGGYPADASFKLDGMGLELLLQTLDANPTIDIVGAITKFCVYAQQDDQVTAEPLFLPDFTQPISTLHSWCNHTWGSVASMRCMPGGGTLGRTLVVAAIMAAMTDTFPNLRGEDAMLTILAKIAGFREELCGRVYVTNRCPTLDELTNHNPPRPAWLQQFVRWYSAIVAVDRRYGADYTQDVIGPENDYLISSLAIFAQTLKATGDSDASLQLLKTLLSCRDSYTLMLHYVAEESLALFGNDNVSAW